ncbi:hypothetical protein [Acidocella sp.]|uniref:hypothetical protein n=1 Tax=Acidocella sp. TaxID=50710 RepID=UPI002627B77E|nr:hypothetical protein [Acidocella sp.]
MWQEQPFTLAPGHPSAAGHFPGNPIIPGALLLDAMIAAIPGLQDDITIHNVKFLRPIRHGTALRLLWQGQGFATRFECRTADDALVMAGTLIPGAA